jgi:hypothetical protein
MNFAGKGFFIWTIVNCEGGSASAIASTAADAGLSHVLIKIADGTGNYNLDSKTGADLVPPVSQALRNRGIQVWGWHYIYGYDPVGEADKAVQRVQQLGVDAYVIDAEAEFKETGKDVAARQFMSRLRAGLPNFPVILCSYRFPSYHPQFPWKDFLDKCDYNMPQVYWSQAHNPGEQLIRSVREFQGLTPSRPLLATGSAYKEGTWSPTSAEVIEFMQTAQSSGVSAVNFWEWAHCRKDLPDVWTAIKNYSWSSGNPSTDIVQQYITALNTHDSSKVVALYNTNAVHVTAARTVQGVESIRIWYNTLFSQILPNATFNLTGATGTGSTRNLTWTATSSLGRVNDGNDTFGLADNKILYHYSRFTVSS